MKNHTAAYMNFSQEVNAVNDKFTISNLDKDRVVFLNQFADCFSNSLPRELPPESLIIS